METFVIECRYETLTSEGKKFTDWFVCDSDKYDKDGALNRIKEFKENLDFIDKKTKLKHEYRLKSYKEHMKELAEFDKIIKKSIKKNEEYFKSDEYKELQKKKRQSAKERKERQKKYLEEHS